MNRPEDVLKSQTSLSVLSGTKWICLWLIGASVVVGVASLAFAPKDGNPVVDALSFSLPMIALLLLVRHDCENKIKRIRNELL